LVRGANQLAEQKHDAAGMLQNQHHGKSAQRYESLPVPLHGRVFAAVRCNFGRHVEKRMRSSVQKLQTQGERESHIQVTKHS